MLEDETCLFETSGATHRLLCQICNAWSYEVSILSVHSTLELSNRYLERYAFGDRIIPVLVNFLLAVMTIWRTCVLVRLAELQQQMYVV